MEREYMGKEEIIKAEKVLERIVPKAGEIIRKYYLNRNFETTQKAGVDFTTQADIETDEFLRSEILKHYPSHTFLTEETAPKDWNDLKTAEKLWVIDPLDGTINFSRGEENFAISVAFVSKSKTIIGISYNPMTDDYYMASEARDGAYKNGKQIKVSEVGDLRETVLACDWAWGLEKRLNVVSWLREISPKVRQIKSIGSAVADLARLAEGKIDVYIHSGLKPWDVASSAYLIEKAGGKVTKPDGSSWDVFEENILASNSLLHPKILELIGKSPVKF